MYICSSHLYLAEETRYQILIQKEQISRATFAATYKASSRSYFPRDSSKPSSYIALHDACSFTEKRVLHPSEPKSNIPLLQGKSILGPSICIIKHLPRPHFPLPPLYSSQWHPKTNQNEYIHLHLPSLPARSPRPVLPKPTKTNASTPLRKPLSIHRS